MHTLIFIILMMFAALAVGFVGPLFLEIGALNYKLFSESGSRLVALITATIVNAFLIVAWTAFVILWVERGTPPYNPAYWAAVVMAVFLAIAPIARAYESSMSLIARQGLTLERHDLLRSLGYLAIIQFLAAGWMIIDSSALHWWRWLPLTG